MVTKSRIWHLSLELPVTVFQLFGSIVINQWNRFVFTRFIRSIRNVYWYTRDIICMVPFVCMSSRCSRKIPRLVEKDRFTFGTKGTSLSLDSRASRSIYPILYFTCKWVINALWPWKYLVTDLLLILHSASPISPAHRSSRPRVIVWTPIPTSSPSHLRFQDGGRARRRPWRRAGHQKYWRFWLFQNGGGLVTCSLSGTASRPPAILKAEMALVTRLLQFLSSVQF